MFPFNDDNSDNIENDDDVDVDDGEDDDEEDFSFNSNFNLNFGNLASTPFVSRSRKKRTNI